MRDHVDMNSPGYDRVQALRMVLVQLGRDAGAADDSGALETVLRGQGLTARSVTVPGGALPDGEMTGALLELADGSWLPLLSTPLGLEVLSEHGPCGLAADGIVHAGRAVLLVPRVDVVREFLPFLRRHKGRLAEIMAGGLIVNVLALLFPLFGSFVYDKVLGNGITETLWALVIGLALSILLDYAIRAVRALLVERFAVSSEADIDHALFRAILSGDAARVPSVGLVLEKYKQILGSRDFLSSAYMLSALDIPFLLLFLVVIAAMSGPLVLVPIVVGLITIGVHAVMHIPAMDYERQSRRASEKRFALLADALTAREAIVGGQLRDELARQWRRVSDRAGTAAGRARYWHTLAHSFSYSAGNIAYLSVILGGAYMIEARSLTTGGLLAATMLTSRTMAALNSIVLLVTRYKEFRHALNDLDGLMPAPAVTEAPTRRGALPPQLRVVNMTSTLRREGRPTLQGIDLKAGPGEIIGIAGHPGAGKTTLLRLIAGVLKPDEGEVLIANLPVGQLAPGDVSATLGYKPQDPCLLEDSIEANIRAGNREAASADIERALAWSGLGLAMEKGELNLSTPVGPRGTNLSGGQRQMVALARAFLGAPPILLLDEPNTGLDAPMEKLLADNLAALREGRLILVSTHSRALLSQCTRIIVMDQGRIITDGPRQRVMGE